MSIVRKRGNRDPERIRNEMEDIFHSMLVHARSAQRRVPNGIALTWRPPIEVYETEDALWVLAEIAGLSQEQIELAVDDRILTIRGERPPLCGESHRSIHEMGILYGPFAADVYLPFAVDYEQIEASYENGLLRVRLQRVQPTRVAINLQQPT
jgi:HSP20 family molecular chaperone IbpA